MRDQFELSVTVNNEVHRLQAVKQSWGDSHRYALTLQDAGILFEPDNEGSYRAVFIPGQDKRASTLDPVLLIAIARELKQIDLAND